MTEKTPCIWYTDIYCRLQTAVTHHLAAPGHAVVYECHHLMVQCVGRCGLCDVLGAHLGEVSADVGLVHVQQPQAFVGDAGVAVELLTGVHRHPRPDPDQSEVSILAM